MVRCLASFASSMFVLLAAACVTDERAKPAGVGVEDVHILLTSDEHGWIVPLVDKKRSLEQGGAQQIFNALRREGYEPSSATQRGFALLSSGDMWTGPFEDVVLKGSPMVRTMDRMGYAAAALGNHEFDFGLDVLKEHADAASFPFVAANLFDASETTPNWVKPFVIVRAGSVALGIVGLTNTDARATSDPRHMVGLEFGPYAESLDRWVPAARAAGARQVVVVMHDGLSKVKELLPVFRRNHVRAVLFGHDHHAASWIDDNGTAELDDDLVFCNGGPFYPSYCRIDLAFREGELIRRSVALKSLALVAPDRTHDDDDLARIIADAEHAADAVGAEVVAVTETELARGPHGALGELVVDSWLAATPKAQIAMLNAGGLRQDLQAGEIRLRDVLSALPFDDKIMLVQVSGAQVREALAKPGCIVGGVRFSFEEKDGVRVVSEVKLVNSGAPLEDDQRYVVAINDFMYDGGDHYRFGEWDRTPTETGVDWRDPLLQALRDAKRVDRRPDGRAAHR